MEFELSLTSTQMTTLKDFFEATTKSGSLSFEWNDPLTTSTDATFAFMAPPLFSPVGANWLADVTMELLP